MKITRNNYTMHLDKQNLQKSFDSIDIDLCCILDDPTDLDDEIDGIRKKLWALEIALLNGDYKIQQPKVQSCFTKRT